MHHYRIQILNLKLPYEKILSFDRLTQFKLSFPVLHKKCKLLMQLQLLSSNCALVKPGLVFLPSALLMSRAMAVSSWNKKISCILVERLFHPAMSLCHLYSWWQHGTDAPIAKQGGYLECRKLTVIWKKLLIYHYYISVSKHNYLNPVTVHWNELLIMLCKTSAN